MVRDDPATFACICATLLPKQPGETALSNEQIEEYYAFLSERMQARRADHGKETRPIQIDGKLLRKHDGLEGVVREKSTKLSGSRETGAGAQRLLTGRLTLSQESQGSPRRKDPSEL